jgi:hypothetical protein
MARVTASATKSLSASPDAVFHFLRSYREGRPRILTENYSNYRVEAGGVGEGTVFAYHFAAGRRERDYRLTASEGDRSLTERDELSSFVNDWTVSPADAGSTVTLEASWDGAGGIGGFFERRFAPAALVRIYDEVLTKLEAALASL